jgi:hypothetical protein
VLAVATEAAGRLPAAAAVGGRAEALAPAEEGARSWGQ